jgi:hypothetical protein
LPLNSHETVKMLTLQTKTTSNFEVPVADSVNTKATIALSMKTESAIENIDEEENLDHATATKLAKIVEFLLNLED